jgi:hypothetical protein
MTESVEIDEILRKGKERSERLAESVPLKALTKKELNKHLVLLYRMMCTLQVECDILKVWVDDLRSNQQVSEEPNDADDESTPEATD